MAYNPTNWKDQIITDPTKYKITKENGTQEIVNIEIAPQKIIQQGTRITADKLNNIEQGIKGAADLVSDLAGKGRTEETVKKNADNIGKVSAQMAELATNKDTSVLNQALLSNSDGTATFKNINQLPNGGNSGQFLEYGGSSGTAKWVDNPRMEELIQDTTLSHSIASFEVNVDNTKYEFIKIYGNNVKVESSSPNNLLLRFNNNQLDYKYESLVVRNTTVLNYDMYNHIDLGRYSISYDETKFLIEINLENGLGKFIGYNDYAHLYMGVFNFNDTPIHSIKLYIHSLSFKSGSNFKVIGVKKNV